MTVYKRFGEGDVIVSVLNAAPRATVVSGSGGWRGNLGPSGAVRFLDGIRSKLPTETPVSIRPTYRLNSYTIDGLLEVTGSYPVTSSVRVVKVYPDRDDLWNSWDRSTWGREHWGSIENLYEHYGRYWPTTYSTSSYDFYTPFFVRGSENLMACPGPATTASYQPDGLSSGWTIEARIKPFSTSSTTQDFTIASKRDQFSFFVSGSGLLALSGSTFGVVTASIGPSIRRWSHVAARYDGVANVSFYIDGAGAGSSLGGALTRSTTAKRLLCVGGATDPAVGTETLGTTVTGGLPRKSFHGFVSEVRVWGVARTDVQLSGARATELPAADFAPARGLQVYYRLNEGPAFSFRSDFTVGSGSQNVAGFSGSEGHSGSIADLKMLGFDVRRGPVWHPRDDGSFVRATRVAPMGLPSRPPVTVIEIPSVFYGRQISTGSVELVCSSFTSGSHALRRVLVDDGRGGLYLSGSACSASLEEREGYRGVSWNRLGNVFYSEGLIVINDPALLDFGAGPPNQALDGASAPSTLSISFRGKTRTPSITLACRMDHDEYNSSNNPTYSRLDPQTGRHLRVVDSGETYVTAVGIFDDRRRLVAVAKLAQPIRKRTVDRQSIRLRFDL